MPGKTKRSSMRGLGWVWALGVTLSPVGLGCGPGPDLDSREAELVALPGPILATVDPVPVVRAVQDADDIVYGTIKHEYTDASNAIVVGPLGGPRLRVLDSSGAVVASSHATSDGSYTIPLAASKLRDPPYTIEVRTDTLEIHVVCGEDEHTCSYQPAATFTPNPFGPRRFDITVPVEHAGPFHILDAIRRGYGWYRNHRNDAWRLGRTRVVLFDDLMVALNYYDRDRDTIYIAADVPSYVPLYAQRRDQFHDSVILHQFARRLLHVVGGYPAWSLDPSPSCPRTEPGYPPAAWQRGAAIYLAQAIIGSHRYESCDCSPTFGTDSHDIHDMSNTFRGTTDGSDTGDIAAGLVTALLWDLTDSIAPGEADFLTDLEPLVVKAIFEMRALNRNTRHGTPCCRDLMDFLAYIKPRLTQAQRNDLDHLLSIRFHLDSRLAF